MIRKTSDEIFKDFSDLTKTVKKDLRKKGLVPASLNTDGSVRVGNFSIVKDSTGFYSIIDSNKTTIEKNINLPHTAAILANKLALGLWSDRDVLNADRRYGHLCFDETLYKQRYLKYRKKKLYDQAEIFIEKFNTARLRKQLLHTQIVQGFEKLLKIE